MSHLGIVMERGIVRLIGKTLSQVFRCLLSGHQAPKTNLAGKSTMTKLKFELRSLKFLL